MKKTVCCIALVMALLLCACQHAHTAAGDWERSPAEHWKLCECGEKCEVGEHTLDEWSVCTVCGAEVVVWDDGEAVLSVYDDHGNIIYGVNFDADGNPYSEGRNEITYDDDGNLLTIMKYAGDELRGEEYYRNGEIHRIVEHYEDGTRYEHEYDEHRNLTSVIGYDADGSISTQLFSEYAETADGEWYEVCSTETAPDGSKYYGEFNDQGDQIVWITYTPDGVMENNERYEYTYDEEGHKTAVKVYSFDTLVQEKLYTMVVFEDGWMNYPGTVIDYQEDGGKTVCVYDENDELVSQTHYDAGGNVIE